MAVGGTKKINPDDFILSVLSPEDRLAAFKVAGEAFKKTKLTMKDIIDLFVYGSFGKRK